MTERAWKWLESTVALQRDAYGFDPARLERDVRTRADAIRDNVLPLVVEAVELLDNVSWKYWAHDEPFVDRERVLKEAVDVAHFLANVLTAIGATDEEFWEAYRRKQAANAARQRDGYRVLEKDGHDD